MKKTILAAVTLVAAAFVFTATASAAGKPKLVVLVSFDQMRGDYPATFAKRFGQTGFARIASEGVVFDSCLYEHANLLTGPGHATLLTGCYPHKTGIPSNDFCEMATHTCMYCAEDPVHGLSAYNLRVPTVGDVLRESSPKSKVAGIGIKDRASILMAGKKANPVLWLDYTKHEFTTSSYYQKPAWLQDMNAMLKIDASAGLVWQGSTLSARTDDQPWEGMFSSKRRTFPYTIPDANAKGFIGDYTRTPYSVTMLFAAVRYMIDKEQLGADDITDILCVGVSQTDFVGHTFGSESREVEEFYAACDTTLGNFITTLDSKIGRDSYMLIIASDHGVAPVPEALGVLPEYHGLSGGRVQYKTLQRAVDSALTATFGFVDSTSWVFNIDEPSVYLNDSLIKARNISMSNAISTAMAALRTVPGIAYVMEMLPVMEGVCPPDVPVPICKQIAASTFPPRMGQILVYPRKYWIFGNTTATHGTPYEYDRHIPLMWLGGGIKPARVAKRVEPVGIAATLARILDLDCNGIDGVPLPIGQAAAGR